MPLLLLHHAAAHRARVRGVPTTTCWSCRGCRVGVRYSVYAATFYLTMLFGNFGGADFIYFQF